MQVSKVSDPANLEKVFAIRREVFVGEQNCPPELEWEFEDESIHFLATVDDVPAGPRVGAKQIRAINWNVLQCSKISGAWV